MFLFQGNLSEEIKVILFLFIKKNEETMELYKDGSLEKMLDEIGAEKLE